MLESTPYSKESVESGTPLVSVGIPTFNRPEGLRRTLEYITGQTYKNIEIIVSDNASTHPQVQSILNEFSGRDSRIRYFVQKTNIGMMANLQFVFEQSTGDFFMWASDDDRWHESFIANLVLALQESPDAILAFCDFRAINYDGSPAYGYPKHNIKHLRAFSNPNTTIRCVRYFFQDGVKGKASLIYGLFRRDMIQETNLVLLSETSGDYALDVLFIFRILQKDRAIIIDNLLYEAVVNNEKLYDKKYNKKSPRVKISKLFRFCKHSSGMLLFCILALIPVQLIYDNLPFEKFFKRLKRKEWNI